MFRRKFRNGKEVMEPVDAIKEADRKRKKKYTKLIDEANLEGDTERVSQLRAEYKSKKDKFKKEVIK